MLKIKECPHCHSNIGYYAKYYYSGNGILRYSFDGTIEDNSDMYDGVGAKLTSKYYYCLNCNKKIEKIEKVDD